MDTIEVFIQGQGHHDVIVLEVVKSANVAELISAAFEAGLQAESEAEPRLWLEDEDEPLEGQVVLVEAGIGHGSHVHIHGCHQVEVTVNYNGGSHKRRFSPSSTLAKVKRWAVSNKAFNLSDLDTDEHALQLCGSSNRPDPSVHLGTLTSGKCEVCFDLVPKRRVEG